VVNETFFKAPKMRLDFTKMQGLIPAIVQDSASGEILMLGFMNDAAWGRTLSLGYVTFFSRSRNELWTKGETSGNRLKVVSVFTDCDNDSLLIQAEVEGAGVVCHEGTRSCFTKALSIGSDFRPTTTKPRAGAPAPHLPEPAQ
jgi:phosphoribosyl-AMP cyclohydrolase